MWGWISYDPELDLIFHGTGNPGPWNPDSAPATTSGPPAFSLAIRIRAPHAGSTSGIPRPPRLGRHQRKVLLDMSWEGQHGRCWSGRIAMATSTCSTGPMARSCPQNRLVPECHQGSISRPGGSINPDKEPGHRVVRDICPTAPGAKDWNPRRSRRGPVRSTSRTTICAWTGEGGGELHCRHALCRHGGADVPGTGGHRGEFTAWDAEARPAGSFRGLSGLERSGSDGGRRCLLWNHGRLV